MSADKLNLVQIVPNWHSLGVAKSRDKCSQYANIAVGGYLLRQQVSNWMKAKVFTRYNNVIVLLISVLNPMFAFHVPWTDIEDSCPHTVKAVL